MKQEDKWIQRLFAFGGALFCAWLSGEARKSLENNWRENNGLGILVSAGAMGAAQAGCALSLKELFRLIGLPAPRPYLSKRKRNPLFLPDYEPYPA